MESVMNPAPLFVLLTPDNKFVKGGGSSTKPFIRIYDSKASAKRGLRYFRGCRVVEYSFTQEVDLEEN